MKGVAGMEYDDLVQEAADFIAKNRLMVLATSAGDRVTARMMSVINDGLVIYFQIGRDSHKFEQITANNHVALCIGNMQYEGIAAVTCQPLEDPFFVEHYRRNHEGSFKTYSHLRKNVVVRVSPTLITFWKYDEERKPYRDILDVEQKKAYREYYPIQED